MDAVKQRFRLVIEWMKTKQEIVFILVLPFLMLLATELVYRGSFVESVQWMQEYRNQFLVSYLLCTTLLVTMFALSGKINWSFFIVLSGAMVFSLMSNIKVKFKGEPILPWDMVLRDEAGDIVQYFNDFVSPQMIFFIVVYIGISVLLIYKLPKKRFVYQKRAVIAMIALLLLNVVYFDRPVPIKRSLGIESITWDQSKNSQTNGLLLSFMMNVRWMFVDQPEGYSEEAVSGITEGVERRNNVTEGFNPNIIVVMNEAFWDPTVMEGVSFSEDPIPVFRSLQEEHTSGTLLVPVFGGGTVNTEFEVLTGHSMHFLPGGSIAYAMYLRNPTDSLASILARQGYNPIAIHSYHNWFYRRNEVFRDMGFNKYISSEFFVNPEYAGGFISDAEVSRLIIDETERSEEPVFIFAVTMQNHGPYHDWKNEVNSIQVEGDMSEESRVMIEAYAQGLVDADQSLAMLVDYFEQSGEPTMIVFFGDHLPFLGKDHQAYREVGYYHGDRSYEEYMRMYQVPMLIWTNYEAPNKQLDINSSYLGSYILSLAQREGSIYTDYLYRLSKQYPYIPARSYYDVLSVNPEDLQDYKQLQYDLLLGERYGLEQRSIVKDTYHLGRGKMMIDRVEPGVIRVGESFNLWEGQSVLHLYGENFAGKSHLYINGRPLPTDIGNEGHLTAIIPQGVLDQPGQFELQLKLYDSMDRMIAQSNTVTIEVVE